MGDAIVITRRSMAVFMLLTVSSTAKLAFGATNTNSLVQVVHVHLVGEVAPVFHKRLMDLRIRQCAMQGTPVAPPPPRTPLHATIADNYYATGGMSSYNETKIYMVDLDCRLIRKDTLKITTWTALGVCSTDRETKRSTGECNVDIASLAIPPDPKALRKNVLLNGESKVIAGHQCTFLNNPSIAPFRSCIAREGIFANVVTRKSMSYGATLRIEHRDPSAEDPKIITTEATEIHTNVMIPLTTFAPQLSGKYKIISTSLPKTENDE
ncbi:MAG: hypothetical protein GZ090_10940 [Oxalobacteraceae bacterium]|nr:hypothetical protein [Oxalobacteraceae bacterium]